MPEQSPVAMVDFNRILVWANAVVAALMVWAFVQKGANEYLDAESLVLALLLSLQTHVVLLMERRRRDPFVVLLAFILIFYFSFRICTLLLIPFSFAFERYEYTAADSNRALLFIVIANLFLYAGLHVVRGG